MPVTMKGSPMPVESASPAHSRFSSPWSNDPLPRFNKFSSSPSSAWEVRDGTLGTFMGPTTVNDKFSESLRDLGRYGVSSKSDGLHPPWKATNEQLPAIWRTPKRMRTSIAGEDLGPAFMQ